jgi:Reverse transcriptase (RNA-dependent DNA polymerase)
VTWNGSEPSWIHYTPLLYQHPTLVRDYAISENLVDTDIFRSIFDSNEPGDPYVTALKAATSKPRKIKFGLEVPSNITHAFYLDRVNDYTGEDSWAHAIKKELAQLEEYNTFSELADDVDLAETFKEFPYQFDFDVKFDLRKKARLVSGGHQTDPPTEDIYSGAVEFMTVRLCFLIASMNGLLICAADIGNAYLHGPTREEVFIIAGREFGAHRVGKRILIVGGLYGLRSSGARFHEHISRVLRQLGRRPSKADADFWIKRVDDH